MLPLKSPKLSASLAFSVKNCLFFSLPLPCFCLHFLWQVNEVSEPKFTIRYQANPSIDMTNLIRICPHIRASRFLAVSPHLPTHTCWARLCLAVGVGSGTKSRHGMPPQAHPELSMPDNSPSPNALTPQSCWVPLPLTGGTCGSRNCSFVSMPPLGPHLDEADPLVCSVAQLLQTSLWEEEVP